MNYQNEEFEKWYPVPRDTFRTNEGYEWRNYGRQPEAVKDFFSHWYVWKAGVDATQGRTFKELESEIKQLNAQIKQLKAEREPLDYEDGWYWADYGGVRQIGIAEDGEVWFVGYYKPVPLSDCSDISLITDPLDVLQEWNDNIDRLATPPR